MPDLLPEWTPVRCVLLAWPSPHGEWQANYPQVQACYWALLQALSQNLEVWVLMPPELEEASLLAGCVARGINLQRVTWIGGVPYNDTWIRDYGPISTGAGYLSFTFNGWGGKYPAQDDNNVAQALSEHLGARVSKLSLVCEGGALETNGTLLLMNADCVVDERRNPHLDRKAIAQQLQVHLGPLTVEWLEGIALTGDDTDGHIDTMARFAPGDRLLYSGRNPQHPDAPALEALHQQVSDLAGRYGWQLSELPTPEIRSRLDQRVLPATYANFLIANQSVYAPVYDAPEDVHALSVLKRAFPNYRVIPVRCEALLEQHGSLHCATMQVAQLPTQHY